MTKVLVVEDDEAVASLLTETLSQADFDAMMAQFAGDPELAHELAAHSLDRIDATDQLRQSLYSLDGSGRFSDMFPSTPAISRCEPRGSPSCGPRRKHGAARAPQHRRRRRHCRMIPRARSEIGRAHV